MYKWECVEDAVVRMVVGKLRTTKQNILNDGKLGKYSKLLFLVL